MMLVDSHCHLDFPDFAADLDATVTRARAADIGLMLTVCTYVSRFEAVRTVAEHFPDVVCSVGVHPHNAAAEQAALSQADLHHLASHAKVVAIGECGLDYYYDKSPRDAQAEVFRTQVRASLETGLPLIIHTRDADDDTIRILEEEGGAGKLRGVFHCFSGTQALAEKALALGFHISFSGIVTFKKADELRQVAAMVPADRLLVETDAPYLAPPPFRGKRNEPAYVARTAAVLAETRGVAAEDLARTTTANFFRLFDRARPIAEGLGLPICA